MRRNRFAHLRWSLVALVISAMLFHRGIQGASQPNADAGTTTGGETTEPRIVGGTQTQNGDYPWMVALVTKGESDLYAGVGCGASLIHPYWVLTAAHCIEGETIDTLEVAVGVWNLSSPGTTTQRIPIAEIVVHPGYSNPELGNDLALLLLERPVTATTPVLPLIEDPALENAGVTARAIGWGDTTNQLESYPTTLRQVDLPVLSLATANQASWYNGQLISSMLPAGRASGGIDTCQGDSGGPLLVPGLGGKGWNLAGITSYGDECAQPNKPGIYTRVSSFRHWIYDLTAPGFSAWEKSFNLPPNTKADPDGDGLNQWAEYLCNSNPTQAGGYKAPSPGVVQIGGQSFASLSFPRRSGNSDVAYGLERSTDLVTWTGLDVTTLQVGVAQPIAGESGMELVTYRSPNQLSTGTSTEYLRVVAKPSRNYVVARRPLAFGGNTYAKLMAFESAARTNPKEYIIVDPPVGTTASVELVATGFTPILTLIDAESDAVLATGTGTGSSRQLEFTPQAGKTYMLRVNPSVASATGSFKLAVKAPTVTAGTIGPNQSINGTLSTSDPLDPDYLPAEFYYVDNYTLSSFTANKVLEVTVSSTTFSVDIYILDAITMLTVPDFDFTTTSTGYKANFTPAAGERYVIQVTSLDERETGSYSLTTKQ